MTVENALADILGVSSSPTILSFAFLSHFLYFFKTGTLGLRVTVHERLVTCVSAERTHSHKPSNLMYCPPEHRRCHGTRRQMQAVCVIVASFLAKIKETPCSTSDAFICRFVKILLSLSCLYFPSHASNRAKTTRPK